MSNIAHVQQIYAAFGRGDIPAILARLADDVEWEYGGTPEVPWLKPLRGVKEVPKFFEAVGGIESPSSTSRNSSRPTTSSSCCSTSPAR